ncbi:hypothetical protein REPUB_Repub20aG0029300 [Reevesia pubescens]
MAERMLFSFAGKLLGDLASLAYQELGLTWGVKVEISKLKETISLIKGVLRDAEEQQRNNNHEVTIWIGHLKDVLYDVDDLLDDFSTEALRRKIMSGNQMVKEVRVFFSKSNQLAYSLKMGRKVKAIRERLDKIAADKAKFHFSDNPVDLPLELKERDQTHSFVREEEIIGRDDDKKKFLELLLESKPDENVSVVPIVGIGGLGKTTLAKMVFNDDKVGKHFELKMWVCVSEKFEVKVIVEKIIEAATGSKPKKDLQMETLQNHLRGHINGKKYLLVLDDVWNQDPEKWRNLRDLLLGGARGSWIVLTTRSGLVAEITGTFSSHILEGLSKSESWCLLKQMAFKEQSQESCSSHLEAIGMEIVEKCKGVPLALRTIGNVLFKRTEAEWLKVKNNVFKYMTQQESGILPILKLSYDHLPLHLRQCFAYYSLIPKDTVAEVKSLIRLWIAQGYIQPLSGDEDPEDVGREYFLDLLWRSFFQVAEKDDLGNVVRFTMHDLMHDLACSVAGNECCIASLEAENVNERTRHVLYEDELDSSWKIPNTFLKAKRVRTFIQSNGGSLNPSTCSALVSSFKYLRMLDLSFLNIERLPHSIGKLKHLRDLDLSGNNIEKLPSSLSRLQNLQTLDLIWCVKLKKLPRKTRRLVSLRHLHIDGCDELAYMPRGLGQLTCLRTLKKFVVGKRGRRVGQLRELNGLNNLKGELCISSLQNAIPELGSSWLKEKLNLKSLHLRWRKWRWSREEDDKDDAINVKDETVFEGLQPHPNLEKLEVDGYPGSKISSWLSSITNLTELILVDCVECKHLPPLHQLSSLKFLKLSRLTALENASEIEKQKELSCAESTTIFLPTLEELSIEDCPNLKGWWKTDVDEATNEQLPCFPCLSDLYIAGCPNLTSMPLFPLVRVLTLKETSWKPVQQTMKLKRTTSESEAPSSSSSSSLFPHFSKLEILRLEKIEDLDSLPEDFLQNLTSLQSLSIIRCINLTSMPEGMQRLTSLENLQIFRCPQLRERCRREIGVDWPNIAHIKYIGIDGLQI